MESLESWKASAGGQARLTGLADDTVNGYDRQSADWLTVETASTSTVANGAESSIDSAYESASSSVSDGRLSETLGRSRVFLLSAKEDGIARSMMTNLHEYLVRSGDCAEEDLLDCLAYTLGDRRSRFPWSVAVAAQTLEDLTQLLEDSGTKPGRATEQPRLGFVFTGQGAQWYGMGKELIEAYPVFKSSLRECGQHLKELGASWSLIGMLLGTITPVLLTVVEELTKDEKSSRVNNIVLGPPLCIAVQISLVRLLASWGIKPTAITSHSSGEVAAAFAAGAIDCRDAMAIVFARGPHLERLQEAKGQAPGGMMAVGLSSEECQHSISQLKSGKIGLAAVNSPSSVTVSGDLQAVEELERDLANRNVFTRRLKITVAYHSHHMAGLEKEYLAVLRKATRHEGAIGDVIYASPVTGKRMPTASKIAPEYWVQNMLGTVEFHDAFRAMCIPEASGTITKEREIDMVVEIGPHGALAGPIRQILLQPDLKDKKIIYGSCLSRNKDAVGTMQNLACSLLQSGYPVDLNAVNFPCSKFIPRVLHDLPNYPWNHQTRHWAEPRLNQCHRFRAHPQHELLGSLMTGTNRFAPIWRNIIRPSEIPWVRDHMVQGDIIYPAAGLMVMAIEAIRQVTEEIDVRTLGYELRDVDIKSALVISEIPQGVEVQLSLRPCSDRMLEKDWSEFLISSVTEGNSWTEHCKGSIRVLKAAKDDTTSWDDLAGISSVPSQFELRPEAYPTHVQPKEFFKDLRAVGITHGPAFLNMTELSLGQNRCVSTFSIADTKALMPGQHEYGHIVHPTTLDSIIQGAYGSLPGIRSCKKSAMVPKFIKSLFVSKEISHDAGHSMKTYSILNHESVQGFEASTVVFGNGSTETRPILEIDGLFCKALGMTGSTDSINETSTCSTLNWDNELHLMDPKALHDMLKIAPDPNSRVAEGKIGRAVLCFVSDALASLTAPDVEGLSWYHNKFYEWMKLLEERVLKHSTWIAPGEKERATLLEEICDTVDGQMVVRLGTQLVRILRQQVAPLELMLEGQLLYGYYKTCLRLDRSYAQVSRLIKLFKHKNPQANILEVGGGTGGCTQSVLDALGGGDSGSTSRFAHYDFTDISAGFFEQARERFAAWGDLISFKVLDVEQEPHLQGFAESSYDLVVACQVLHATRSMKATMTHVRKLLKPGGTLIAVETTNDVLDIQFIFGTLPGWWMSRFTNTKLMVPLTSFR